MIKIIYDNGTPVAVIIDGCRIEPEGWPPGYFEQIAKNAERYLKYIEKGGKNEGDARNEIRS